MSVTAAHSPARTPRTIHAAILLVASGLTVLVTAILGPSLAKMQQHFAGVPNADYLVPLTMTMPMLVMAILSVCAGALADRFGRKRMLLGATALYAIFGTAPMWLDSLYAILCSRVLIGAAEAVIMTVSTTMIGDYYFGARREKFMALQTTVASASAVAFNIVGGMMGDMGWRAPYCIYFVSLLLAPLMARYLWEPRPGAAEVGQDPHGQEASAVEFRPLLLAGISVVALFAGLAFLIVPVHLAYLMGAIGVQSSAQIGAAAALNSLGVVGGTLLFGWVVAPRLRVAHQLALSIAIAGAGFVMMGAAATYQALTMAAIVNGLGFGVLLPTMVTWNMRELPFSHRGLGTGAFQSCLFLGMFANPIVIVYFAAVAGGRTPVLICVGPP